MSAVRLSTLLKSIAVNILSAALVTKAIWHTKEIASIANKGGQNERTMYSYLRLRIIGHLGNARPAHYDFNTGEMVLLDNDALAAEVPSFVKVRRERALYNNQ